MIKVGTVD